MFCPLKINPFLDEGRDDIMGRDIPEHQAIALALREAEAEAIVVNDVQVTPNSSVEILRSFNGWFQKEDLQSHS